MELRIDVLDKVIDACALTAIMTLEDVVVFGHKDISTSLVQIRLRVHAIGASEVVKVIVLPLELV
jgi:hypothetical protein|tara:strand:- start:70 stop:264 length:195 start_codon:yes stop_codon:yes gene_type:complete